MLCEQSGVRALIVLCEWSVVRAFTLCEQSCEGINVCREKSRVRGLMYFM